MFTFTAVALFFFLITPLMDLVHYSTLNQFIFNICRIWFTILYGTVQIHIVRKFTKITLLQTLQKVSGTQWICCVHTRIIIFKYNNTYKTVQGLHRLLASRLLHRK